MAATDDRSIDGESVRRLAKLGIVLMAVLSLAVMPAAATHEDQDCSEIENDENRKDCQQHALQGQMNQVGSFLALVIGAVAIPNGAFGVFQWMTAGTDTEQTDKGRKRIRNSFIGVAGAGAVMVAVRLLSTMIAV